MSYLKGRKRQAAAILRAAAKDIESFGWVQGRFGSEASGFCAMGGLGHHLDKIERDYSANGKPTAQVWDDYDLAFRALAKVNAVHNIAFWNDATDQTKDGVLRGFRKAASALEHGLKVT